MVPSKPPDLRDFLRSAALRSGAGTSLKFESGVVRFQENVVVGKVVLQISCQTGPLERA